MAEDLPPFESTSSSITPQSIENDATEDVIPILQSFQDILSTEIFVRGITKADFRVQYGKESQHPGHFKLRMWLRKYKNVLDSESNIDIYDPAAILSLNKTFTRQIAAIEKKRKHVETQPSTIEDVATAVKVKRIRKKQASEGIELKMNTVVRKQRKLLIFDLNKVVMFHNPYFQSAILRPFAQEFIKGMHMHYNIAIWTSKNKKYIRDDIATLFGGIDLLFEWYQPACVRKPKDVSGPDALPNSFNSTSNAYSVGSEKLAYTLSKPLSKVWQCYPEFHEYNTILLDDSPAKCLDNPVHTRCHPEPFLPCEGNDFARVKYRSLTPDYVGDLHDKELQPHGRLWQYLVEIADVHDSKIIASKKPYRELEARDAIGDDVSV